MSQPTPYTIQADFSADETANVSGRSTIQTTYLDVELENLKFTLDKVLDNLELLQRDDEKIKDGIVNPNIFNLSNASGGFLKHNSEKWEFGANPTLIAKTAQASAEIAKTAAELAQNLTETYRDDAQASKLASELAQTAAELAAQSIATTENLQSGSYWYETTGGNANEYTLTLSPIPTINPSFLFIKIHEANTLASTININGIGAVNIKKNDGMDPNPGDLPLNGMMILVYDGSNYVIPGNISPDNSEQIASSSRRVANLEAASSISDGPLDLFNNDLYSDATSTNITSESTSGQKDVVVASVTGLAVGMSVDLIHSTDNSKSEIAKISSINNLTLTMESNLNDTYPSGSHIKRDGLFRSLGKKKLPFSSLTGMGDGRDGSVNLVTATTTNLNTTVVGSLRSGYADSIERVVLANPIGTAINVGNANEGGFSTGDLVLLMNKQGSPEDNTDVGNFEILTVASASKGVINVNETIFNSYEGNIFSNQKITVQRIPQYTTVTINNTSAKLSCNAWDGTKGGTLIFVCSESLTLTAGEINVTGLGYRGGIQNGYYFGQAGEGSTGVSDGPSNTIEYTNANGNGGGAGNATQLGGAGGGNGTAGGNTSSSTGGSAIGNTNLTKMYLGGGGGAGGHGSSSSWQATGGIGGGIAYICAKTANITGAIKAEGTNGAIDNTGGGGGAGGTIFIKSKTLSFSSSNRLLATGGSGGGSGPSTAGGEGRVKLDYTTIDTKIYPDSTEENDASNPNPGSTERSTFNILSARHRSILTQKPQRDIESIDLWSKCSVTTSHSSTSGTEAAFIIGGIIPGEQTKYGIGDTVLIKLSTGKYLETLDETPYSSSVTGNATSGEISVDIAIPSTFSGATLQRLDSLPRASIVTTGSNENMEFMKLQLIEETNVSNEIETEWFLDKKGSEGQDVIVEIGLSVEDASEQENAYCEQYTTNLNYA